MLFANFAICLLDVVYVLPIYYQKVLSKLDAIQLRGNHLFPMP